MHTDTRQLRLFGFTAALALGGALVAAPRLEGQFQRGSAGGSLMLGFPVGEFADYVGIHGGFGGHLTLGTAGRWAGGGGGGGGAALGLRFNGSALIYGHQDRNVPLAGTGGLIVLDLNTDNYIATLTAGPQVTIGRGALRVYGWGGFGVSYFGTSSNVRGTQNFESFASTTNFDDVTYALEAGTGFQVRVGGRRWHPVFLDVSTRFLHNGRVSYVTEDGVVENADGSFTLYPVRSRADVVVLQLGVSVGLR